MFFHDRRIEEALYEQLVSFMRERLPAFELRVQKTQITFVNPAVFACISLKWKNSLLLTFGLPDMLISPRVYQAVQIRPGRWTIHVKLTSPNELNAELANWMGAAYAYAKR